MVAGRHEAEVPPDGTELDAKALAAEVLGAQGLAAERVNDRKHEHGPKHERGAKRGRRHRRVSTKPVAGSDPNPQSEPPRHAGNENDDRLKADKPPHWG